MIGQKLNTFETGLYVLWFFEPEYCCTIINNACEFLQLHRFFHIWSKPYQNVLNNIVNTMAKVKPHVIIDTENTEIPLDEQLLNIDYFTPFTNSK
jgi:hypothetical protein